MFTKQISQTMKVYTEDVLWKSTLRMCSPKKLEAEYHTERYVAAG